MQVLIQCHFLQAPIIPLNIDSASFPLIFQKHQSSHIGPEIKQVFGGNWPTITAFVMLFSQKFNHFTELATFIHETLSVIDSIEGSVSPSKAAAIRLFTPSERALGKNCSKYRFQQSSQ